MKKITDSDFKGHAGEGLTQYLFYTAGFVYRQLGKPDSGIDGHAELRIGSRATGQLIAVQVKSGPSFFGEENAEGFVYRGSENELDYWLDYSLPVVIVICDLENACAYWQQIRRDTTESTGVMWKTTVPKNNKLDHNTTAILRELVTPIPTTEKYSILNPTDSSHAIAKRCSVDVQLIGDIKKGEVAYICREIILVMKGYDFQTTVELSKYWQDIDAHLIDLFFFVTPEDASKRNYVCRCRWIDPEYTHQMPDQFDGEEIGDGMVLDWNANYEIMRDLLKEATVSKGVYVRWSKDLVDRANHINKQLLHETASPITDHQVRATIIRYRNQIDEIWYKYANDDYVAPVSCENLGEMTMSCITLLQGILLMAEGTQSNDGWLYRESRKQLQLFAKDYAKYEIFYSMV